MKSFDIKNRIREARLFQHRLIFAIILVSALSILIISRLVYLQGIQYKHFAGLSENNEIDLKPIVPRRGIIYDRNGVIIAKNVPVFNLVVVPSKTYDLEAELFKLNNVIAIDEKEIDQFYKQLKQHRRFEEIPLKMKLTGEEMSRFSVNSYKFPGISVKAQLMRDYPFSQALAHVLGYVGRINEKELQEINTVNYAGTNFIGKLGIEKYFENELHGSVGYKKVEKDVSGREIRDISEIPSMQGSDLYLTIDSHLQIAAGKALGNNRGSVVVINPENGEILALVSLPSYDPNLFVSGISDKEYLKLQHDSSHPLYNRALRGLYAPGSSIKPFVALEGLDSKVITKDFKIVDKGWYKLPHSSHVYHDWLLEGHGVVNLEKAIIKSCNTYFYNLANKLGIKKIDYILGQFGFGKLTGIEMQEEVSGNLPTPEWKFKNKGKPWYAGDTVVVGIGQGYFQVTPLQLAKATAILANNGIGYKSHLLYAVNNPHQGKFYVNPVLDDYIFLENSKYWNTVIHAMEKVVSEGTGYRFGKAKYSIAAKTGTAQVISNKSGKFSDDLKVPIRFRDNSIFIAFAPVENPRIAVAVIVENSKDAPVVARKVVDYCMNR